MKHPKDTIFAEVKENLTPFRFDDSVASVFNDMISRSVPSYQPILSMLPTITRQFRKNEVNYYDLGCSLGAGLHAMAEGLKHTDNLENVKADLIGVDTSKAMLERARSYECPYDNVSISFIEQDIMQTPIENAAMVLMNFTLQFIPVEQRDRMIQSIANGLNPDGVLILSEKVCYSDKATNDTMIDIHHRYKADQGYSQLEISQKRDAIENVLIPETLETHLNRLKRAGFSVITPWLQNLQFISILAIKN